jgi:hypothetical protein
MLRIGKRSEAFNVALDRYLDLRQGTVTSHPHIGETDCERKERDMTEKNHCDLLAERFKAKAASGLKDVKFYLQNRDEIGPEEVCMEVERLYAAIDAGKFESLNLGDFKWKEV